MNEQIKRRVEKVRVRLVRHTANGGALWRAEQRGRHGYDVTIPGAYRQLMLHPGSTAK